MQGLLLVLESRISNLNPRPNYSLLLLDLNHLDRLPIHVVSYNQSMDLDEVREFELPRVGGCICADGAFEAHTAALFEPYADEPDNYGVLTYSQEEMDRFILAANEALQMHQARHVSARD